MVRVKNPIALRPDENAFIEKTLHYISGIHGVDTSKLSLSTNTKFPTRYIVLIRGLPAMSMEDFDHVFIMNDSIRSIAIDMANETIQIDVWRAGHGARRKSLKRKLGKDTITSLYDLSSVDKRDRNCLSRMLLKLNGIDEIECQFDVQIDTSQPEHYRLNMSILDPIKILSLKNVLHECRSFCKTFEFDFPHNIIRAKCLRLAAPLTRRRLLLKR
tara:strand:+ start:3712 stop:4356 length:645 start_codon:yes stop_codon:yes gene_type:complete